MAAIGEQILGPTDVSLSNWTVRPSSGCSVVLTTHTAGAVSVDGCTLTLAANPWNIVRTYNLTPGRELLFACRCRSARPPTSWCTCRGRQRLRPLYGSFVGDQGAELRSCSTSRRRACPTRRQERWTSTDSRSWTRPWRPATRRTAASALLLRHEILDGGADDVTLATRRGAAHAYHVRQLPGALQQPELWPRPALRWEAGGLRQDPERLRLEHCAYHTLTSERRHSFGCRHRLDFSVPPGGVTKLRRSPGWCSSQRARWTCACRSELWPSRES